MKKKHILSLLLIVIGIIISFLGIRLYQYNFSMKSPEEKGLVVIRGDSMLPTLSDNQICYITPLTYDRGEIVVLTTPYVKEFYSMENKKMIKRIIGLPGEIVEIKEDGVYINREKLNEDYTDACVALDERNSYHEILLSDNEYFVLGDNREESFDSRAIGPIGISYLDYAVTETPNDYTKKIQIENLKNMFMIVALIVICTVVSVIMIQFKFNDPKNS